MTRRLLSLGSINADFQLRVACEPGSRETLQATDLLRASGGKAANRAFLARRLGYPAVLLGCVGDDDLAAQALGAPQRAGVDVSGVHRSGDTATAVSMIAVPDSGKKQIILAGNANDRWTSSQIDAVSRRIAAAGDGDVVTLDFEIAADAAAAAARAARERGLRLVIDPSFPQRCPRDILALADACAPNVEEAVALTRYEDEASDDEASDDNETAARCARMLAAQGCGIVCVKRSDGGCVLLHDRRLYRIDASSDIDVVDATGAGDAFTGALAVGLLDGRPVPEAAVYAVSAAQIAVQRWGSQDSYPDRAALDALAVRLGRKVHALGEIHDAA
jgi:ribokinase